MSRPRSFSWIEENRLAGSSYPRSLEEVIWLRENKAEVIITLTETPLPKDWIDESGIMSVHVPVVDFSPPSPEQLQHCLDVIHKAHEASLGVVVHCAAGIGRTGTVLAAYLIDQHGLTAPEAIQKVRNIRPGSIEAPSQERALYDFALQRRKG